MSMFGSKLNASSGSISAPGSSTVRSPSQPRNWLTTPRSPSPGRGGDVNSAIQQRAQDFDRSEQMQKTMHEKQMSIVHKQAEHITKLMEGLSILREEVRMLKSEHGEQIEKAHGVIAGLNGKIDEFASFPHHTMAERVQYLEQKVGDSADKHDLYVRDLQRKLEDVHGRLGSHQDQASAAAGAQSSVDDRLKYLEQFIGESVEKHARDMQDVKQKNGEFHGHHATMEQRMSFMEQQLNDSADLHSKSKSSAQTAGDKLKELEAKHEDRNRHLASYAERIDYLEKFVGDSADKHLKAMVDHGDKVSDAHKKLEDAFGMVSDLHGKAKMQKDSFEKHSQTMEQRMVYMEKFLGESADKHEKHAQAFEQMNRMYQELDGKHKSISDLSAGERRQLEGKHVSAEKRMEYLEKCVGDSADKHKELENAQRILEDTHGRTKAELDAAHKKLGDVHGKVQEHATVAQRIGYVEKMLGDSADKHDKHLQEFQAMNQKMQEMHGKHGDLANRLSGDNKARESAHAGTSQRLEYLEKIMGDSADKHAEQELSTKSLNDKHHGRVAEIDAVHKKMSENHANMQQRIQYLEKMAGDSADRHADVLAKLADVHGNVTGNKNAHATVAQRLDYMEKLMGDSAEKHKDAEAALRMHQDNHNQHKNDLDSAGKKLQDMASRLQDHATLPQRIQYIEEKIGHSADMHAKHVLQLEALQGHIQDLKGKHSEHQNVYGLDKKSRESLHANTQQRLEFIEKAIGDSADKHKEMELAHRLLHDNHHHSKGEIDAANKKSAEIHANVGQRVSYLEKIAGDSADKHDKHIEKMDMMEKALREHGDNFLGDKRQKDTAHATTAQRMDYLEKMMGDSADKHREMDLAHRKLVDDQKNHRNETDAAGKKFAELHGKAAEHHASIPQRIEYLEKICGDNKDKHDANKDEFAQHGRNHAQLKDMLAQLGKAHADEKANRDSTHATMGQRMDFIEKAVGDSADKHKEWERMHKQHGDNHSNHKNESEVYRKRLESGHASMQQRMDFLEKALGDSADLHAKDLASAHGKLKELHGKMEDHGTNARSEKNARENHASSVGQRLDYLERAFGDSADKHNKHMKEIQDAHGKLNELSGAHSGEKKARDEHHATLQQRLDYLEGAMGDSADKHSKEIDDAAKRLKDLGSKHDDHKNDVMNAHADMQQRVKYLEGVVGESADKMMSKDDILKHVGQIRDGLDELHGGHQTHKLSIENRLDNIEQLVGFLDSKMSTGMGAIAMELEKVEEASKEQDELSQKLDQIAQPLDVEDNIRTPGEKTRSPAYASGLGNFNFSSSSAPAGPYGGSANSGAGGPYGGYPDKFKIGGSSSGFGYR